MIIQQKQRNLGTASFRVKLLVTLMLAVSAITGLALFAMQHNVASSVEEEFKRDFQSQLATLHDAREVRLAALAERCHAIARKPHIDAVFEDNALDLLYPSARDELHDVMEREDEHGPEHAAHALRASFYRFLNEHGAVIAPKGSDDVGDLGGDEVQLAMDGVPPDQQIGYILGTRRDGRETVHEVLATPIISGFDGVPIAALVLGFKPIEPRGNRLDAGFKDTGIKYGIWMKGGLHLPGFPAEDTKVLGSEVAKAMGRDGGGGSSFQVRSGGARYLLFYKLLNPGSRFPPAYEVCLYPLADSLGRLRQLRWQIIGAGVLLLLGGLLASHFVSAGLSKPVETLEVVSTENAVQRKRAEQALELTNEELQERNVELGKALAGLKAAQQQVIQQERLRALGQMASGIAHDFNNALVPILGYCELLQLSPGIFNDPKKCNSYLATIQTAAEDAASVVSRLREFYRANEKDEKFTAVDLPRLAQQAIQLTQPKWKDQAQAAGATVSVVSSLEAVPPVTGDESALREVLTNLIFNAVDAMPGGGTITVRTRLAVESAVLEVADSGTGMTEEVRQRCLEPFFSTKGEHGTGLGLSMVFGIVQRHSGHIDLRSELGKGTTFTITLPLHRETETIAAAKQTQTTRTLRVLVVDDEAPVRDLLTAALANDGHHVEIADQGVEGLRRFMAGRFDLVVADKAMPGMSGDQMATAIKQVSPRTPIILLTGFGQFLDEDNIPNVDVLASKPIGVATLRDAVARAIAAV